MFCRFDGERVMETVHGEGMSCAKGEELDAAWDVNGILGILVCLRLRASLGAQMVKNLPAMQETQVPSLGGEDPLRKKWMERVSCFITRWSSVTTSLLHSLYSPVEPSHLSL